MYGGVLDVYTFVFWSLDMSPSGRLETLVVREGRSIEV